MVAVEHALAVAKTVALSATNSTSFESKRSLLFSPKTFHLSERTKGNIVAFKPNLRVHDGVSKFVTSAVAENVMKGTALTKSGRQLELWEALREGIEEEMGRDPHVCVIGEDVGHYGGSYKVTKGLASKFGDLRILDTPIAENSFIGMAVEPP